VIALMTVNEKRWYLNLLDRLVWRQSGEDMVDVLRVLDITTDSANGCGNCLGFRNGLGTRFRLLRQVRAFGWLKLVAQSSTVSLGHFERSERVSRPLLSAAIRPKSPITPPDSGIPAGGRLLRYRLDLSSGRWVGTPTE
jgi:hypothetical protein